MCGSKIAKYVNICLNSWICQFNFQSEEDEAVLNKVRSKKTQKKYDERKKQAKVEQALEEQFATGRVLGEYINFEWELIFLALPRKRFCLCHVRGNNLLNNSGISGDRNV